MFTRKPKDELVEVRFVRPVAGTDGAGLSWQFAAGEVRRIPAEIAERFLRDGSARRAGESWGPPAPADGLKCRFVRLAVGSTERGAFCYGAGHVVALPPREAHRFIRAGDAEWVTPRRPDPLTRVVFTTSIAGFAEDGSTFDHHSGEIAEIPESQAGPWVVSGICRLTDEAPRPAPVSEAAVERIAQIAALRGVR